MLYNNWFTDFYILEYDNMTPGFLVQFPMEGVKK